LEKEGEEEDEVNIREELWRGEMEAGR